MSQNHHIKCWPTFFAATLNGSKTFEFRYNDRDYQVGDFLTLREYDPNESIYTGRTLLVKVTSMFKGGSFVELPENWVIMAIHKEPQS